MTRLNAGLALAWVVMVTAGCVTINIYFPAAAAEKAADRIIDEVWQLREGQAAPATGANTEGAPK
ncbi:MAG TPA: hypothetical protein PLR02_04040 [Rhodocyclaceae bacterium]|nr:hypothetical protein [Rhodocyclaceae bacterium]